MEWLNSLKPEHTVGFFTTLGALVGIIGGVIIALINSHAESKRHKLEIIIKSALDSWKYTSDMTLKRADKANAGAIIYPSDLFIVRMLKISKILDGKDKSAEEILEILKNADATNKTIKDYMTNKSEIQKLENKKPD
ncbi:MAG: hypothetical protein WDA22_15710 [Bacteroidota bacterium]